MESNFTPKRTTEGMYFIGAVGNGGRIPEALKGLFTKSIIAQAAITAYENSKPIEEPVAKPKPKRKAKKEKVADAKDPTTDS